MMNITDTFRRKRRMRLEKDNWTVFGILKESSN